MSNGLKGMMLLLAFAACGTAAWVGTSLMAARRMEAEMKAKQITLKTVEEKRRAAEAEAEAKKSEARKAEAKAKQAEAEKEKAVVARAARAEETATEKARTEAAQAEKAARQAAERAAAAETKRLAAAKAEADARRRAKEAENKNAELLARRAEEERRKAEAELSRTLAAKITAEAALKKSENDLKAATLTAEAERDRKLRMYRRAETSRAEMLELKRAEQALALEEAGLLPAEGPAEPAVETGAEDPAKPGETNRTVVVTWKPDTAPVSPAEEASEALGRTNDRERRICLRRYVETFGPMIAAADRAGRRADALRLRRTLLSLVEDPVTAYLPLIEEALKAEKRDRAVALCGEMVGLVPDWRRVGVMAELLKRNEERYGGLLAGLTTQGDFVRAFRKLYDEARLGTPDHDERDRATAGLCAVLARYVPDYAHHPDWR